MSIAVTGATGHLGRLIIESLITLGSAPTDIVAVVRDREKASDLAAQGIQVNVADYADKAALAAALVGVERLVLISSSELGKRAEQHRNVIEAAQAAGVSFITYTSLLHANTSPLSLGDEHRETEAELARSGIDYVLLRNGWYWENFASAVAAAKETGHTFGASGSGKISGASRRDYAQAAATVVSGDELAASGTVYELAGEVSVDAAEIAEVIGRLLGAEVTYVNQTQEEYAQTLTQAGLPAPVAEMIAGWETGIAQGALFSESSALQDLIKRPATSLEEALQGELTER